MTVNENIRRIRLEKGMTQKQVAEACGTVDAAIRTYELGKANPKPATVAKIARALGVSPAELYGMDDTAQADPSMAAAICQSESGGVVDADAIYLRRIGTSLKKLNNSGKEEAAKRVEELEFVPAFSLRRTVSNALGGLTEDEQNELLAAYQSLENAEREKAAMEKTRLAQESQLVEGSPQMAKLRDRYTESLKQNEELAKERKNDILNVILTALERSKTAQSDTN